ncbi:hypothetical protein IGI04_010532 [Brassica rapa subsp. trilocularis]|uniref:SGNH hydrolase-type esterase domain-containing protein n=1 Tax=Brassica rapa subsp. trilocularis TaxID=1813537 RepID=A0ABQ7N1F4_BRACM|nr:hypothetical protein IGI04_010532 [Brassica rapa subsp. trilocularis]
MNEGVLTNNTLQQSVLLLHARDRSDQGSLAMVGPGRPQIVLFGSSIVQYSFINGGWGASLADVYSRTADIILRGYGGWNSRYALKVLDQVFPKDAVVQPSLVIVYFGGNDSKAPHPSGHGPHVPLSEFIENMRKIGEHLLSLSDKTRVIFLSPPPMNETQIQLVFGNAIKGRSNEVCRPYAEALLNLCNEINVKSVDLWNAIQQQDDWLNTCFTAFTKQSALLHPVREEEAKKAMVGPGRPQIVLFGSSIVQYSFSNGGWGASLADVYSRTADVVLRGYGGWNSRFALKVLDQVFPKDAVVQPSLVIVYFGGNDSMPPHPSGKGAHVPLSEFIDNMRKIGEHLLSLSDKTRVIFLSPPPMNERQIELVFGDAIKGRRNEVCRPYAEALLNLCNEINVKCVDLWNVIQQQDDWLNTCFTDGIHFTAKASEVVVKEVLKVVREAEWKPSLYWKSLPIEFPFDYGIPNSLSLAELELFRNEQ